MRPARPLLALACAVAFALPAQAAVDARLTPDQVTITDDGKPVLVYRTRTPDPAQPGRLNYIHPLYAPDGTVLTEDAPADHPHQRGVFWAWHQVRLNGQPVADGWFMTGLTYFVRGQKFQGQTDGSGVLTLDLDWMVSKDGELVYVASETTRVTVHPLAKGGRTLDFDTAITPKVDGLSLGGSDDAKGYGGFSIRLVRPDQLTFASQGKPVQPQVGQVSAGSSMGFTWPVSAGYPAWAVGLACKANGQPVTQWILRRELSMQNCAFPGRVPVQLRKGEPLRLQAAIVIQPRKAP